MKHLLFTALLIVATTKAYAEREFIPLQVHSSDPTDSYSQIRHAPPRVSTPIVEIVENVIYIRSRQTGVDLTIALEDIDGNNIYNVCTTTNDNLSIWISQDILNKAHIITINIDGKEYFGEI